jgi:hypothetical protein
MDVSAAFELFLLAWTIGNFAAEDWQTMGGVVWTPDDNRRQDRRACSI